MSICQWEGIMYECAGRCVFCVQSTAECFSLIMRSLEMVANSSFSHNLNPILEGTSTKGFRTQSYFSVFSEGK